MTLYTLGGQSRVKEDVATTVYKVMLLIAAASMYNKWPAVAAQTARSRCKVLSIKYVSYFRAYQRQCTEDKSFAEKSGN